MDIRDYFAGQALKGLMKEGQDYKKEKSIQKLASVAYQIADALLEARERPRLPSSAPEIIASEPVSQSQDNKDSKRNRNRKIPQSGDAAAS